MMIHCADCRATLPEKVEPCPSCGLYVCEKCFDGTEGMCLACPKRAQEQPVYDHEGQEVPSFGCDEPTEDLNQPVTYQLLAEKLIELEQQMRQEHAIKRAAFEERLAQRFEERWSKGLQQIAQLLNKTLEEVTP